MSKIRAWDFELHQGSKTNIEMASSDYGGGPVGDREYTHGHPQGHPQGEVAHRREDEHLDITPTISQNGAPTNAHLTRIPGSPALSAADATDLESRRSGEKNRSKPKGSRTASGQARVCKKCGEPLTGQFVRALDGTFHLDCFKCRVSPCFSRPLWTLCG